MNVINEIKKESWPLVEIYFNAKENFNYCYYFHNPKTSNELEYVGKDRDLKFIRHSLWRLTIIDLAKLLSEKKSDRYNIKRLISKLKPAGQYSKLSFDESKIANWENYFETNSDLIARIITLRDKIYAHRDLEKEKYAQIDIYFSEIEQIFDFLSEVIKTLYAVAFNGQIDLNTPIFDREEFDLVRILADNHKRRIEEILKNYKR